MFAHDLRCPTDTREPEPPGYCYRCSRKFYLRELSWQWEQVGPSLHNTRLQVCRDCLDAPATFLAPIRAIGLEGFVKDPRPFIRDPNTFYAEGPSYPNFIPEEPIEGFPDLGARVLTTDGGVPLTGAGELLVETEPPE